VGGSPSLRADAWSRLRYNLSVARSAGSAVWDADLVLGFDMDGFALRRPAARYVVCLKGVMADELRFERGWPHFRFRALSLLEAANARRADVVIVTSQYSRSLAIDAYGLAPERVRVVPEGIDLDPAWRASGNGSGSDESLTASSGPVILSVARQYRRKNTIALLRAMPFVRSVVPGATLRVIGGGPELARLQRERSALDLEASVALLGELPTMEAVRAEYRRADVFCLPSHQEGFGIVFLEAMAAGLPIVALRTAAIPEVVPDGETGLLVNPDRPEALREALIRLLRDPGLRAAMGRAGTEWAKAYAWPEVACRFLCAAGFNA
jgi:glycosyltransferase involved in cell wall biosynthesis